MMVSGMALLSVGPALGQVDYGPDGIAGTADDGTDGNTALTGFDCDSNGDGVNDGRISAGGSCDIGFEDDDINGARVGGTGQSTPFTLPVTQANGDRVTFQNVRLPADFELGANHTFTLTNADTGQVIARKVIGVSKSGTVTAPIPATNTGQNLPKTGTDYVDPALKIGGALLVAGGAAVLVARRRKADAPA